MKRRSFHKALPGCLNVLVNFCKYTKFCNEVWIPPQDIAWLQKWASIRNRMAAFSISINTNLGHKKYNHITIQSTQ